MCLLPPKESLVADQARTVGSPLQDLSGDVAGGAGRGGLAQTRQTAKNKRQKRKNSKFRDNESVLQSETKERRIGFEDRLSFYMCCNPNIIRSLTSLSLFPSPKCRFLIKSF